ncbi:MAG: hypothetical protein EBR89_04610 [Betaproteobacteria bacterium]|nr:hypothetical protein [Betaproteobacteria bacterium]
MHIVLSHALPDGPNCKALLTRPEFPPLPHLQKLFTLLARSEVVHAKPSDLTPLHERLAYAHLHAQDGLLPLGALAAHAAGLDGSAAWGLLTLCHFQAQSDHVAMREPDELDLDALECEALVQAMRPYFLEDGLHLHPYRAGQWLVCGEPLRDLPTASLDRVRGQAVDPWMPQGERARPMRRLQNEMQMLLYTHPVNDSRAERGLTTVNAFWLSGTGSLPPNVPTNLKVTLLYTELRDSALRDDAWDWAQAWAALDADHAAHWLVQAQDDASFCLSLCGTLQAHSFTPKAARTQGWLARVRQAWSPTPFSQRLIVS